MVQQGSQWRARVSGFRHSLAVGRDGFAVAPVASADLLYPEVLAAVPITALPTMLTVRLTTAVDVYSFGTSVMNRLLPSDVVGGVDADGKRPRVTLCRYACRSKTPAERPTFTQLRELLAGVLSSVL